MENGTTCGRDNNGITTHRELPFDSNLKQLKKVNGRYQKGFASFFSTLSDLAKLYKRYQKLYVYIYHFLTIDGDVKVVGAKVVTNLLFVQKFKPLCGRY